MTSDVFSSYDKKGQNRFCPELSFFYNIGFLINGFHCDGIGTAEICILFLGKLVRKDIIDLIQRAVSHQRKDAEF